MNRHIVNPLLSLLLHDLKHELTADAVRSLARNHLIYGHRPDRSMAFCKKIRADFRNIAAGTEIHDRIRTVFQRGLQFRLLLFGTTGKGGVSDVRIDLGQKLAPDPDRFQILMIDVRRNDDPPVGDSLRPSFTATRFICSVIFPSFARRA